MATPQPLQGGVGEPIIPPHRSMVDHVEQVRDRMAQVWPIVRDHLRQAQQAKARVYYRGAQLRIYTNGGVQILGQVAGAIRGRRQGGVGELPGMASRETHT